MIQKNTTSLPEALSAPLTAHFTTPMPDAPTPEAAPISTPAFSLPAMLRALGNPARLAMFTEIANTPEGLTVDQIAKRLRRRRSMTGRHLVLLRDCGLVVLRKDVKDGREAVHILHPALRPPPGAPLVLEMGALTLRL